mmetsp:Transcript_4215/g.10784  ORF Transcript_4215/g.10784 Transcript_4215/m.10784 type:complete len:332 (-) Transcript_4215:103-1098(-)
MADAAALPDLSRAVPQQTSLAYSSDLNFLLTRTGLTERMDGFSQLHDADAKLPRGEARVLEAWLSASKPNFGPFRAGKLAPPPPSCRVLAPEPVAPAAALALGRALGAGSEMLLLLRADEWELALASNAELRALDWQPSQRAYEPPWFQQRSAIRPELFAPLDVWSCRPWGAQGCLQAVCLVADGGLLDPRAGPHSLGLFDRVIDRGGFARCPAELRAGYATSLAALVAPGGRALVCSAEPLASSAELSADVQPSPGKRQRPGGRALIAIQPGVLREAFSEISLGIAIGHLGRSVRHCAESGELWCADTHVVVKPSAGEAMIAIPACPCCR